MTTRAALHTTLAPDTTRAERPWASGVVPSLLLVAGAALGPGGLAILTPSILAFLDPAAPVALAVFGVLAALDTQARSTHALASATARASIAGVMVATALTLATPVSAAGDVAPMWTFAALVIAVAAATSTDANACGVPFLAGGLLLAFAREGTSIGAALFALQGVAISIVIAAAGWMLLSRAATRDEQRITLFATLLLLGGAADYVSMSALLCGGIAGACWRFASSSVREHIRRDTEYAADSLLVLVLLLAGAHADYSLAALTLGVAYAVTRAAGTLAGKWIGDRVWPVSPRMVPARVLAPGMFGVAFALNVSRALGDGFAPVLAVVVVGTIAASMTAALYPREAEA